MLKEAASLICKNKLRSVFACLLLIDAAAVVGGLAAHSSWIVSTVAKNPIKYTLNDIGIVHVVLWAIGPPSWFFLETYTLDAKLLPSTDHGKDPQIKADYDRLRLAQDLASKVWAAVLAAILVLAPKS